MSHVTTPLPEGLRQEKILEAENLGHNDSDTDSINYCFISVITEVIQLFNPTVELRSW
jgi:hypothetical protein